MTPPEQAQPLPPTERLPRSFYEGSPAEVAERLLGQAIFSFVPPPTDRAEGEPVLCGGWIVETEAYLASNDPASHSAIGPRIRNASMFAEAGTLYVYTIHTHYCLNVVTEQPDVGSAVLIRAVEPVWGIEAMGQRRGPRSDLRHLCRGPGRLCRALGIDKRHDGADLVKAPAVWIAPWNHAKPLRRATSPRIGISKARDLPLRFFVDRNRYVSGRAADHSDRPTQSLLPQARLRASAVQPG